MRSTFTLPLLAATALATDEPTHHETVKKVWNESTIDLGVFSIGWKLHGDLGYGYEAPLYNDFDALVWRPRFFLYGGGLQKLIIENSAWFTWTLYFDTNLAKLIVDPYLEMSLKDYSKICYSTQWVLDTFRAALYYDFKYTTCKWGILGTMLNNPESVCDSESNYIS